MCLRLVTAMKCKQPLEEFLPLPEKSKIEKVELLDPHETSKDKPEHGKTYVLDLKAKISRIDKKKGMITETVNIEIQTTSKEHFTNRILAYAGRIYSDQLTRGENYKELRSVYSLVFTTANLREFASTEEYYHVCQILRNKEPHLLFSEGISFIVVELNKFRDEKRKKILDLKEAWCYFLKRSKEIDEEDLKHLVKGGEKMGEAVQKLWNLSKDELLREQLELKKKYELDRLAEIEYACNEGREEGMEKGLEKGREEGMEKGLEKGREEGMEKGIEKGLEKGREEGIEKGLEKGREEGIEKGLEKGREEGIEKGLEKGREEGTKRVALEMLKNNSDIRFICKCTGLTQKEVLELKKAL